jgi:hypothetical protein
LAAPSATRQRSLIHSVINPGFEAAQNFAFSCCTPLQLWNTLAPSWTVARSGGDYRPVADPPVACIDPVHGSNVSWANGGSYLHQVLGITSVPGQDYELGHYVGRRYEQGPADWRLVVTLGSSPTWSIFTLSGNTASLAPGSWNLETLQFNSGASSGEPITVWLANDGGGQVNFDAVPEPSTFLLAGGVLVALRFSRWRNRNTRRRRPDIRLQQFDAAGRTQNPGSPGSSQETASRHTPVPLRSRLRRPVWRGLRAGLRAGALHSVDRDVPVGLPQGGRTPSNAGHVQHGGGNAPVVERAAVQAAAGERPFTARRRPGSRRGGRRPGTPQRFLQALTQLQAGAQQP